MKRLGSTKPQVMFATAVALFLVVAAVSPAGRASAAPVSEDARYFALAAVAFDVGGPINAAPQSTGARTRNEIPLKPGGPSRPGGGGGSGDGALQAAGTFGSAFGAPIKSFDGVGVGITGSYSDCCAPPDTNLAVGETEVVQWVNLDFAVFDKSTGSLLSGYPKKGNSIWSGFGGPCEKNNDGDPIVQYDKQAQRWIMTQFSVSSTPYLQCVAVSTTSTFATTSWNRVAYSFGNEFPDYPKLGVWPDAYYMSFNLFLNGSTFDGAAACALPRAELIAGTTPPAAQCFQTSNSFGSLLPSDLDGATGAVGSTALPPAGAANVFLSFGSNSLQVWKFHTDWSNPSATTFAAQPSLSVPAFAQACNGGTCVQQLNAGQRLDSLGDRLMYRLAYRNFGTWQSLVVTHSVTGSGTAAPRWYELRSAGTSTYSVYQASTYAPDATFRWMSSAAMDKQGNLAVGYSASSKSVYPSIRYTGRLAADPLNTLRAETTIKAGGGSQSGFGLSRWGDYSSMSLDPDDDCTFWYTTEYLKTSGAFNWSTRIASFKLGSCQ